LRKNLRFIASIYHYAIDDLIDQQPDYTFLNVSAAHATGVEFELEGRFTGSLEGRASYAYQNAEDADTGAWLSNSPHHLAKLNLNHPLFSERLIAGVEVQYVGERQTVAGGMAKAYTVGNFTLTARRVLRGLDLSASVYNFADSRYGDPGGREHLQNVIPQDRRGWRIKAHYEF
jgi:iron complex outermembrane receptor protein